MVDETSEAFASGSGWSLALVVWCNLDGARWEAVTVASDRWLNGLWGVSLTGD